MEEQEVDLTPPSAPLAKNPLGFIQSETNALFSNCLFSFHAFSKLGELSENMRILSLNAELAAGRAGEHGNAVRALTQYTRELVNRLYNIERNMLALKSNTYSTSASALRTMLQLKLMDQADSALKKAKGEFASTCAKKVGHARKTKLSDMMANVRGMTDSAENLSHEAGTVSEVMSQAGSIATNIAIEAAAAGTYEAEFEQVAKTMREFALALRAMCDNASGSIRKARSIGKSLQKHAQDNLG